MAQDWSAHLERQERRYRDGEERLPDDPDERQRQLTRMGNAAGGAGLALLMAGRQDEAGGWFDRAALRYRESYDLAPPGSWGRPIGAIKSRILAGDWPGAEEEARWALAEGAAETDSVIGRYAGALALLTLGVTRRPVRSRTRFASGMTSHTMSRTRWRRSRRRMSSATRTRSRASSSRSSSETSTSRTCRSRTR